MKSFHYFRNSSFITNSVFFILSLKDLTVVNNVASSAYIIMLYMLLSFLKFVYMYIINNKRPTIYP